jgi:hypothetical protein
MAMTFSVPGDTAKTLSILMVKSNGMNAMHVSTSSSSSYHGHARYSFGFFPSIQDMNTKHE